MQQEQSPLLNNDHSVRIDIPTLSAMNSSRSLTKVIVVYGFVIVLTLALLALGILAFIPAWPWKDRSVMAGVLIILGTIFGFIQEIIVWMLLFLFIIIAVMFYMVLPRRG